MDWGYILNLLIEGEEYADKRRERFAELKEAWERYLGLDLNPNGRRIEIVYSPWSAIETSYKVHSKIAREERIERNRELMSRKRTRWLL